jgi:K+-sensing histidine kinase KdpD
MGKTEKASVVKIDSSLLEEVEELINKQENRLRFANKKQFINIAVYELLNKIKNENKEK